MVKKTYFLFEGGLIMKVVFCSNFSKRICAAVRSECQTCSRNHQTGCLRNVDCCLNCDHKLNNMNYTNLWQNKQCILGGIACVIISPNLFNSILLRPKKKNSCVQVSLPTLILDPTLKMLKYFW